MVTALDGKNIRQQAEEEVKQERAGEAKKKLKAKLQERDKAQTILDNINRELEDLAVQIEQGNF